MNTLGIELFLRKVEIGKQLLVSYTKGNERNSASGIVTGFTNTHVSIREKEGLRCDYLDISYHSIFWHSLECEPIPLKNIQTVEEFKENIKKLIERFEDGKSEEIGFTVGQEETFKHDVEKTINWINDRLETGAYDGKNEVLEALRSAKHMLLEMQQTAF